MKQFLYFLPGVESGITRDYILAEVPTLAYAFAPGKSIHSVTVYSGPGGQSGQLCACGGDGLGLRFDPEKQDWKPMGTARAPWLGVAKNAAERPGPMDLLAREACLEGGDVLLGDNKHWRVPVVRFINGMTTLPCMLMMEPDGTVKQTPRPEFEPLVSMTTHILEDELTGAAQYKPGDLMELGAMALSVNYRVGPFEISALNLLDTQNVVQIAGVLMDKKGLDTLLSELRKKKEPSPSGPVSETGAAV